MSSRVLIWLFLIGGFSSMPSTPDTPHRPRESLSTPQAQLLSTLNRCIIQVEIVDAVSNFLFGRNAFKVEGPSQPQRKMTISSVNSSFDADGNPTGSCDIPVSYFLFVKWVA